MNQVHTTLVIRIQYFNWILVERDYSTSRQTIHEVDCRHSGETVIQQSTTVLQLSSCVDESHLAFLVALLLDEQVLECFNRHRIFYAVRVSFTEQSLDKELSDRVHA